MGARYLKAEEEAIRKLYPSASRHKILEEIPDRTWKEIGVKARKMRVLRTSAAKGQSVREGRSNLKSAYGDAENNRFNRIYPIASYAELLRFFPNRTLKALKSLAQRRHLHRTREARARQMKIGREEAKKND